MKSLAVRKIPLLGSTDYGRETLGNDYMVDYRSGNILQLGSTGQHRFPWQEKVSLAGISVHDRERFPWQGKIYLVDKGIPGKERFPW